VGISKIEINRNEKPEKPILPPLRYFDTLTLRLRGRFFMAAASSYLIATHESLPAMLK
jgi:hypothetical protein